MIVISSKASHAFEMTEPWCIEYTHMAVKAEAIQKDCYKISDKIQLSLGQKNKIKSITQHLEDKDRKYREELHQKILRLHRHCRTAKCALIEVTNEKRKTRVEQAKNICKKAVKSYEDEYERMREFCKAEIERLEMKRKEIGQALTEDIDDL